MDIGDVVFKGVDLDQRLGREDDAIDSGLPASLRWRLAARCARTGSPDNARTGSPDNARTGAALSAAAAGITALRSQSSMARSRASRARRPPRITSHSVAYSPVDTLAFTAAAISMGYVMLGCWVERCWTRSLVSGIKSYWLGWRRVALDEESADSTTCMAPAVSMGREGWR